MTESERNRLIERLAEDLESTLLSDRKFRASFCVEQFRSFSDEDLEEAAADAGLYGCTCAGCDNCGSHCVPSCESGDGEVCDA
jgi:hypothetical protein